MESKAHLSQARELCNHTDYIGAELICIRLMRELPDLAEAAQLYASCAQKRGELVEAERRWQKMREAFPENPTGFSGGISVLLDLGKFAEAERLAEDALEKFPSNQAIWASWGECAIRMRDLELALERWRTFRDKFPFSATGYAKAASIYMDLFRFVEAENIVLIGMAKIPSLRQLHMAYPEVAVRMGNFRSAMQRWEKAMQVFPEDPQGYRRAAETLMAIRKYDEAEKLCLEAMAKLDPGSHYHPRRVYAEIAMTRMDYEEARKRWAELRDKFPYPPDGYIRDAYACMEMGEYAEAENLLGHVLARQHASAAYFALAESRRRQGYFRETEWLYAVIRNRFPQNQSGYALAARLMKDEGRYDEAEELCRQALRAIPAPAQIYAMLVEISSHQKDYAKCLLRSRHFRKLFPLQPGAYKSESDALISMGRHEEAEKMCREGMALIPHHPGLHCAYAGIASNTGRWPEAMRRWQTVKSEFPYDTRPYSNLYTAWYGMKDHTQAGNIHKELMQKFGLHPDSMLVPARQLFGNRYFQKVMQISTEVLSRYPFHITGLIWMAKSALQMGRLSLADSYCQKAAKLQPFHKDVLELQLDIASKQGESEKVHALCLKLASGGMEDCIVKACSRLISINKLEEAGELCRKALKPWSASIPLISMYLKILYFSLLRHNSDYCKRAIRHIDITSLCQLDRSVLNKLMEVLYLLAKSDPEYSQIRYEIVSRILKESVKSMQIKDTNKKIGFIIGKWNSGLYNKILSFLDPSLVDIIARSFKEGEDDELNRAREMGFNIYYGVDNAERYPVVVTDDVQNYFPSPEQRSIGFLHSIDATWNFKGFAPSLLLCAYENAARYDTITLSEAEAGLLNGTNKDICEVAWTGPYHRTKVEESRKRQARAELAEKLKIHIPKDAPVVYFMEDDVSHLGQTIYQVNRLSKFCTVIFKPWVSISSPKLKNLVPEVILLNTRSTGTNFYREAADITCAGLFSGTLISSILTGELVIPYISRITSFKHGPRSAWHAFPNKFILPDPYCLATRTGSETKPVENIRQFFIEAGWLFDLLDTEKWKKSILGNEYKEWYFNSLPWLRSAGAGRYIECDAAQKTAEYIMKFSQEGTLGKTCSAIYVEDGFFKKRH